MKAAVLGSPIAHSLSPVLHRAAYAAAGLAGWTYQAIECDEAGLPALVARCGADGADGADWAGLSLTMPLKRAILPLLDHVDPLAADVGGANTVVFSAGQRHGYNTDVAGMVDALAGAGLPAPRSAVILGAGATACSALATLRQTGLRTVTVAVRDEARAIALRAVAQRLGVRLDLRPLGSPGALAGRDLLISTVPAGAADVLAERAFARGAAPTCGVRRGVLQRRPIGGERRSPAGGRRAMPGGGRSIGRGSELDCCPPRQAARPRRADGAQPADIP